MPESTDHLSVLKYIWHFRQSYSTDSFFNRVIQVGQRQALDLQASGWMIVLCMIWGIQQVVIKLAAEDISPLMQVALRAGLAAILVYPFIPQRHLLLDKSYLLPGLWLAVLFAAEFLLVAQALTLTSAAHTVVLLYTAPIFVALGLHYKLPTEKLKAMQWLGIGIAFSGIVVAFLNRDSQNLSIQGLIGDVMALVAGIMWAMTTISLRLSKLSEAAPTQTLFYQLAGSFLLLLPVAILLGQTTIQWTQTALLSMLFHVVVMSFFSLMLWFWLLRQYLANSLGVFSFLTPIFGLAFGVFFLGEKVELNFMIGTALVTLGVIIVSSSAWLTQKRLKKALKM